MLAAAPAAMAQDSPWPFEPGEYVEVTGIDIDDGGNLKYAQWLAGEWRANEAVVMERNPNWRAISTRVGGMPASDTEVEM